MRANNPDIPLKEETKQIFEEFFRPDIATVLSDDLNLISESSFELIQAHLRRTAKLHIEAIRCSFQMLPLISD